MKGLHAYHLLNTAGFKVASCQVAGHMQLVGTNGTGKTTNLRIVSYFYNPSAERKDHAIELNKKSFNNFHFKGEMSFVIFEVRRGTQSDGTPDLYHVAVSKVAARVSFLFVDAPYNIDFYLSDDHTLSNRKGVEANLVRRGIRYESVRSYGEYKDIIYGTTRQQKYHPFVFAEPKPNATQSINTIPIILSAIFRAETMKTGTLKEALVASLGVPADDTSINLESILRDLKRFHRVRMDIKSFQKHIPKSEVAYGLFQDAQRFSISIDELGYQIKKALPLALDAKERLDAQIIQVKGEIESVKKLAKATIFTFRSEEKELREVIGKTRGQLEQIEKYESKYPKEQMELKAEAVDSIPELEASIEGLKLQLKLIIKGFDDIKDKYNARREGAENSANTKLLLIEDRFYKSRESTIEQVEAVREEAEREVAHIDEDRDAVEVKLSEDVTELTMKLATLGSEERSLKKENFQKNELSKLRSDITCTRKELDKQKGLALAIPDKIDSLEKAAKLFIHGSKDKSRKAIEPIEDLRKNAIDRLTAQKRIVDKYSGSFLELVDQAPELDRMPFVCALREVVLLTPCEGLVSGNSPDRESVFGLNVDLNLLPEPKRLDYESSVAEIEELSEKIKVFDQEIDELRSQQKLEVENHQKVINKKLADKVNERNQAQVKIEHCGNDLVALEARLDDHTELQLQEFTKAKEDSTQAVEFVRQELSENKKELRGWKAETKNLKAGAKLESGYKVKELQTTLNEKRCSRERELDQVKNDLQSQTESIKQDEQAELDENTDDNENKIKIDVELRILEDRRAKASEDIQVVGIYRGVVIPALDERSALLKKQSKDKETCEAIDKKILDAENKQGSDILELEGILTKVTDRLNLVNGDINAEGRLDLSGIDPDVEGRIEVVYQAGEIKLKAGRFTDKQKQLGQCWNKEPDAAASDTKAKGIFSLLTTLLSMFTEGNHYDFPNVIPDTREGCGELLEKIHSIISSMHDRDKRHLLNQYQGTMNQLKVGYDRMEDLRSNLSDTVKGIEKIIAKDNFVSAVQSIEFRIAHASNAYSKIRAKVDECCSSFEGMNFKSDEDDWFLETPSRSTVSHLVGVTEDLCTEIEAKKVNCIRLEDLYELEVRVEENGHRSDWSAQVDGIGSNGTDKLIKIMIYIAILSHFRSHAFKNADEIHLHSLMDENGAIHSDHVSQLLKFCSDRGVYVGTAAPETHRRPSDFELSYEMCRTNSGKTASIRRYLTHHKLPIDEIPEPAVS